MSTCRLARFAAPAFALLAAPFVLAALAPQQKPKPDAPQIPFPEQSARGCTRLFFWNGDHSGGHGAMRRRLTHSSMSGSRGRTPAVAPLAALMVDGDMAT